MTENLIKMTLCKLKSSEGLAGLAVNIQRSRSNEHPVVCGMYGMIPTVLRMFYVLD